MHRRNVLLGSLGCLLPLSVPVHAQTNSADGDRLKDFPALRGYLASLKKIPAGTFQMGGMNYASEKPVHTVTLSAFRMAATPVTVAVWKEYCKATSTPLPKEPSWGFIDDHPVIYVSWNDIMGIDGNGGFCAWASDVAGFKLLLPTEAQFEYASRGGKARSEFPWGDTFDLSKVWCSDKSFADAHQTQAVDRTSNVYKNAFGLTDMGGNVWQWCSDWYGPYTDDHQTDPDGPDVSANGTKVIRGASWVTNDPDYLRCSYRAFIAPNVTDEGVGFRLVAGV